MSDKTKNKIIMVNSFKGGTGKTSVALAQCVHNWKTKDTYDNIYFLDIDRLGTSLAYALFPEDKNAGIHYFDEYPEKTYDKVCNEVELDEVSDSNLFAVLLNPVARRRQDYDIHGRMQQHEIVRNSIFMENLLSLMDKCVGQKGKNLFVLDCSPGLSDMERKLLSEFYMRKKDWDASIEEIYVTTFDSSQIRKTIECLNDYRDILYRDDGREVSIVLNDVHNCRRLAAESKGTFIFDWKDTARHILRNLMDNKCVRICFRKFEEDQLTASIINNERYLANITDAYVLQQEYRDGYINIDRMDE